MSHAPFDGVLLDDARPPVSGALAMLLHLRVARRLAKAQGWGSPSLDFVNARSRACQELLAQGLLPEALKILSRKAGLDLGDPKAPHGLGSLMTHLEAYLAEVDQSGCLEPDAALWRAVDLQMAGGRGLWIERTVQDGPILAGLHDLLPARLRALACAPGIPGATFSLATRKGDARSGLFGSPQPLVEWFLDGLEQHGMELPNELHLMEPEGWGSAPWTGCLDRLFEGALDLDGHRDRFRRGLVEGPADLLHQAVEQVCRWMEAGMRPAEITLIHPQPHRIAPFLEPILAAEGVSLHVRGGLLPLIDSAAWSPLWMLLMGLLRLDPCAVSAGLRACQRHDLRQWSDILAEADQDGTPSFAGSFMHLRDKAREGAEAFWGELLPWREASGPARQWAQRLEALAGTLRLPVDSDDFFAPLGMLKEAWGDDAWTFPEMLTALRAFLESARSARVPRSPEGLRLVAPGTLLTEWSGSRATLILDVSEGGWPAQPDANPDLDWNRKAAINRALVEATKSASQEVFPPALQRFWLPRSEHGDQIPRAFQQEAYAFNKVLAMTREELVVLSPGQDAEGRMKAQGPFWTALEGAGEWTPEERPASTLRWRWEGHEAHPQSEDRAAAAQARGAEEALQAESPVADRIPGIRAAWFKGQDRTSPTALEGLASCPFRSLAERVWGLQSSDLGGRLSMAVGILAHHVMEEALKPHLGVPDWPGALLGGLGIGDEDGPESLLAHLQELWTEHGGAWMEDLKEIPREQWPQASMDLETLLPNLASALLLDARAKGPTKWEVAFLYPDRLSLEEAARSRKLTVLQEGWTRTLLALEGEVGPLEIDLGQGRSLRVAGKVDRLERWRHAEGLAFLRVTDYKTSKEASLGAYAEGGAPFASHLQTPLYMLIAEGIHGEAATAALLPLREEEPEAFTRHLQTLAQAPAQARPLDEGGSWRQRLIQNLARFEARLEAGDFPPTPGERCRYCQLGALCGRPVDVTVDEGEGGDGQGEGN